MKKGEDEQFVQRRRDEDVELSRVQRTSFGHEALPQLLSERCARMFGFARRTAYALGRIYRYASLHAGYS
jgi:hypothetical protein